MPTFSSNAPFNPNPISKILVVFLTGLTVMHGINICFEFAIICIFLIFYEISFVVFRIQHIPLTFWMKQCSKRYGLGCSNAESTDNRMP